MISIMNPLPISLSLSVLDLFLTLWIKRMWTLKLWITQFSKNYVDYESFLESNSPDILALCETNLDDSIDSDNFSARSYHSIIGMNSFTHMHGLTVYVKEGLPFAWDLCLENSQNSYFCLTGFSSFSVLVLFPLSISFFIFMLGFWFHFI